MIVSDEKKQISNPEHVAEILKSILNTEHEYDQDKEHFWVIGLNNSNIVQYIDLVSLGIANSALVHPREVFRMAILKGVISIIIAHNHPSGTINPSAEDVNITKQLVDAGKIIGIKVLDHVIITKSSYSAFSEKGLI